MKVQQTPTREDDYHELLSPDFESAKSQVLSSSEVSSLPEIFSRILRTESTTPTPLNGALVSPNTNYMSGRSTSHNGNKVGSSQDFQT